MPLVVIQTSIPDRNGKAFRVTEVLDRVASTAHEALEIAASHVGEEDICSEALTVRWHERGGYWLVAWEPVVEVRREEKILLM